MSGAFSRGTCSPSWGANLQIKYHRETNASFGSLHRYTILQCQDIMEFDKLVYGMCVASRERFGLRWKGSCTESTSNKGTHSWGIIVSKELVEPSKWCPVTMATLSNVVPVSGALLRIISTGWAWKCCWDFMIPSRNKERAPKFLVVVKICINTLAMMFGKSWYFLFVFAGSGKVGTTFRRKIGFHYRKEAKYRLKFPNFCSQVCKKVPFLYSNLIRVASRACSILFYFLISKLPNPIFSLIKKSLILLLSCPFKDLLAE